MATVIGAVNIASGVLLPTTVGSLATISTEISRFQIGQAAIVNSGLTVKTVNLYVLQSSDSVANNYKTNVNLRLGAGETYLLYELIGISIDAGGSIQGVVDSGTDVAIFINGSEYSK